MEEILIISEKSLPNHFTTLSNWADLFFIQYNTIFLSFAGDPVFGGDRQGGGFGDVDQGGSVQHAAESPRHQRHRRHGG